MMFTSNQLNTFYLTQKSDNSPFKDLPTDLLPIIKNHMLEGKYKELRKLRKSIINSGDLLLIKYVWRYYPKTIHFNIPINFSAFNAAVCCNNIDIVRYVHEVTGVVIFLI